jgi:nitroreductase
VETWDAIRARRNVRAYEDRPIGLDEVERILEAGRRSPSSRNDQPWDFVVVSDRERLRRLAEVWQHARHVARSAVTIAVVSPVPGSPAHAAAINFDLGQAAMAMQLAATDLGIGAGHAAVADQDLARELLGFPDDRELAWLLALGYPADRPLEPIRSPARRPFDEVVHHDRW